jgi:hypothetical protein
VPFFTSPAKLRLLLLRENFVKSLLLQMPPYSCCRTCEVALCFCLLHSFSRSVRSFFSFAIQSPNCFFILSESSSSHPVFCVEASCNILFRKIPMNRRSFVSHTKSKVLSLSRGHPNNLCHISHDLIYSPLQPLDSWSHPSMSRAVISVV